MLSRLPFTEINRPLCECSPPHIHPHKSRRDTSSKVDNWYTRVLNIHENSSDARFAIGREINWEKGLLRFQFSFVCLHHPISVTSCRFVSHCRGLRRPSAHYRARGGFQLIFGRREAFNSLLGLEHAFDEWFELGWGSELLFWVGQGSLAIIRLLNLSELLQTFPHLPRSRRCPPTHD